MGMSQGILYIAFGAAFRAEALLSISSAQEKMPHIDICLMTDEMPISPPSSQLDIKIIDPSHIRAKVDFLASSPFEKTIYLDSDTLIESDISELFDLLNRFDVLATHDWARKRRSLSRKIPPYGDIPYGFSEVNGGVIAWKRNSKTTRWLARWSELYYEFQAPGTRDQATLRIALWESALSLYILPPEFNTRSRNARTRLRKHKKAMGKGHLKPRIIHLHAWNSIHRGNPPPERPALWRFVMRMRAENLSRWPF